MVSYSKYMGLYDAETKTFTEFGSGAYTPKADGTLIGLRVMVGAGTVATLTEHVQFRLTCDKWTPNAIEVGACGPGLATAPRQGLPSVDWPINQPVQAGVPITLEGRNLTADTPVGVEVYLYGLFE
jgi:hypothetical protein